MMTKTRSCPNALTFSVYFTIHSSWDENPQSLSHDGLGARPEMICVLGNT